MPVNHSRRLHHYLSFVFAILLAAAGWRCEPIVTTFDDIEEAEYYQAAEIVTPPATPDTLLVMSWNIKYGGGDIDFWWSCYDDRVLMTEEEVLDNLDRLADYINRADPDILLLQEVDVDSKRAAYVDQMQYLLDYTNLNYGVYASMWRVQNAPSDGLGRTDLGPAILSRWQLDKAERIGLPLRTDQDPLTTYFYLRRCILKARIPDLDNLQVVTVHTAAWQAETRVKHIDQFKEELDAIDYEGGLFVAGGDLNTLPPGSHRVKDFPDTKCEEGDFEEGNYEGEEEWLDSLYADYSSAIPLDEYMEAVDQSPYFSFGVKPDSLGFTRKLDYLFTNHLDGWVLSSDSTHQDIATAGTTLSDHCPVSVKIRIKQP